MRALFSALIFLLCMDIQAQTVGGVALADIEGPYILVMGVPRILIPEITVHIDFGQDGDFTRNQIGQLKNAEGEPMFFSSMAGAINYLAGYGFELAHASFPVDGSDPRRYWMRKK
jgi:hypothetical protein